jgi:hypothetical protein
LSLNPTYAIGDRTSLLAEKSELSSKSKFSGVANNKSPERIDIPQSGLAEVGSRQITVFEGNLPETSVSPNGIAEIATIQDRVVKNNFSHIRTSEVNVFPSRTVQLSTSEIGISDNSTTEVDTNIRPFKIDPTKIDLSEQTLTSVRNSKIDEIAFPSSISSEKFPSTDSWLFGHNSTPQIINALNNSATNIDSFDEQNIEPEAIYGIKSTNIPLTNILD